MSHEPIFHQSETLFICSERRQTTFDIREAIEWHVKGFPVIILHKSQFVGFCKLGGVFDKISDLPPEGSVDYGTITYCHEDGNYHIAIQDDILEEGAEYDA